MSKDQANTDILGMADDEFLNLNAPPANAGGDEDQDKSKQEPIAEEKPEAEQPKQEDTPAENNEEKNIETSSKEVDKDVKAEAKEDLAGESKPSGASAEKVEPSTEGKPTGSETKKDGENPPSGSEDQDKAPNYEDLYKKIMAPIKANGKTIEIRTPEELIQLAQMGANYTRKMQDIAPHRKTLLMLENNGLLDPDKLAYLIDLDKKNPEAIKKLVKESGIDPMDLDPNSEVKYQAGNHQVTDQEANFRAVLDDLGSSVEGKATLADINGNWDQTSKELLWSSPEVMTIIHTQRENGIYNRITSEIDRQRTLGLIMPSTPFLEAYKTVGDQMTKANAFDDLVKPQGKVEPTPVAVRTAPVKAPDNNEKVAAADPGRTTPRTAAPLVNPLAMSDEDFLKLPGLHRL